MTDCLVWWQEDKTRKHNDPHMYEVLPSKEKGIDSYWVKVIKRFCPQHVEDKNYLEFKLKIKLHLLNKHYISDTMKRKPSKTVQLLSSHCWTLLVKIGWQIRWLLSLLKMYFVPFMRLLSKISWFQITELYSYY